MVNNIVLLINLAGLLLMDALFLADLRINQNIPPAMEAGSEVRVTVNVEKGDLSGFAKLQLDLPPGLSATAIETKGASFTFSDQKAKFIWMALPSNPTFRISYTLKADAGTSGPKRIEGRLSYIENNERKTYDLPGVTVTIGDAGEMTTSTGPADAEAGDLASAGMGAPTKGLVAVMDDAPGIPPIQGAGGVTGKRTITPISEQEMQVEVLVEKGDIRGFGKLQETVPQGFTAIEKSSDEAIFTAQDRVVKFVWLNLPARKTIKVVYVLRANQRPDGEYSIDGEFGYLLNDETQKAVLGTSRFFVGPRALEMLASDDATMDPMDQFDSELALRERQRLEAEAKAREEAARAAEAARQAELAREREATREGQVTATVRTPATRIPSPEKGVTYKVQITAAHREVGKVYFKARHRFDGDFSIERHEGWIKYVTGSFQAYKEARDKRVTLVQAGHEFPGPFVTAYNNGERITVQEALMLTGQQWMQ